LSAHLCDSVFLASLSWRRELWRVVWSLTDSLFVQTLDFSPLPLPPLECELRVVFDYFEARPALKGSTRNFVRKRVHFPFDFDVEVQMKYFAMKRMLLGVGLSNTWVSSKNFRR